MGNGFNPFIPPGQSPQVMPAPVGQHASDPYTNPQAQTAMGPIPLGINPFTMQPQLPAEPEPHEEFSPEFDERMSQAMQTHPDSPAWQEDPGAPPTEEEDEGQVAPSGLAPTSFQTQALLADEIHGDQLLGDEEEREEAVLAYMTGLGLSREEAERQADLEEQAVTNGLLKDTDYEDSYLLEGGTPDDPNRELVSAQDQELDLYEKQAARRREDQEALLKRQKADLDAVQKKRAQASQAMQQELEQFNAAVEDFKQTKIDPSRAWSNSSTFTKVRMIIGAIMVGLGTDDPKLAMSQINRLIDQDIAAQRKDLETQKAGLGHKLNLLSINQAHRNSEVAAYELTRAQMFEVVQQQMEIDFGKEFADPTIQLMRTKARDAAEAEKQAAYEKARKAAMQAAKDKVELQHKIAQTGKVSMETAKLNAELALLEQKYNKKAGMGKGPKVPADKPVNTIMDIRERLGVSDKTHYIMEAPGNNLSTDVLDHTGTKVIGHFPGVAVLPKGKREEFEQYITGANAAIRAYRTILDGPLDRRAWADDRTQEVQQAQAKILLQAFNKNAGVETDKDAQEMKVELGGLLSGGDAMGKTRILSEEEMRRSFERGMRGYINEVNDMLDAKGWSTFESQGEKVKIYWQPPLTSGLPKAPPSDKTASKKLLKSEDPSVIVRGAERVGEEQEAAKVANTGLFRGMADSWHGKTDNKTAALEKQVTELMAQAKKGGYEEFAADTAMTGVLMQQGSVAEALVNRLEGKYRKSNDAVKAMEAKLKKAPKKEDIPKLKDELDKQIKEVRKQYRDLSRKGLRNQATEASKRETELRAEKDLLDAGPESYAKMKKLIKKERARAKALKEKQQFLIKALKKRGFDTSEF